MTTTNNPDALFERHHITFAQDRGALTATTVGLAALGQPELAATVADAALLPGAEAFLRYVAAYLLQWGMKLAPGQSMQYGSWNVQFQPAADGTLAAHAIDLQSGAFRPGVDAAVACMAAQQQVCADLAVPFDPAGLGQTCRISLDLYGAPAFEAHRELPDDPRSSGWELATPDADPWALVPEPLYLVAQHFPDILPYLALPLGRGFRCEGGVVTAG